MQIKIIQSQIFLSINKRINILKQFQDFSLFKELRGVVQKLEDQIYTTQNKQNPIIHLDKNKNLKGLEHLEVVYQAFLKKICLNLEYKSFKARKASNINFHPYILREFNNRWFIVGNPNTTKDKIQTLALDRILTIEYNLEIPYKKKENFNSQDYYKNTIGVTVLNENQLYKVILKLNRENSPYVITKPLHQSQKIIEKLKDGSVIFELKVRLNREFDRLVLGFGENIEVLKPRILRNRIKRKLNKALKNYKK